MKPIDFTPVSLKDMPSYLPALAACGTNASDYSFSNMFGWASYYGLEWQQDDGLFWIRQSLPGNTYWAPIGDWKKIDWKALPILQQGATFIRVPQALVSIWQAAFGERLVVEEARGQWDYLYLSEDLAQLRGNKYHRKKNHLNQFLKSYEHSYYPLSSDCVEGVLEMQEQWCQWNECLDSGTLLAENDAIVRILENWDSIPGLLGGALRIDGEIIAYTVGERLTADTLVVHFEKGQIKYRGIYQAINHYFANSEGQNYTFMNREQDLDDEGLRKAKESYYPTDYVRKFTVTVKPA